MSTNMKSLELEAMTDPIKLQSSILKLYEDKLNEGVEGKSYKLTDPNNTFVFLTEAMAATSANLALAAMSELSTYHPFRATKSEDLYKHMSDFDYAGLFSYPADFSFQLVLDKTLVKRHAVKYNAHYSKIIIPRNTTFKLGRFHFGIHYPIEIRVNNITGSILAVCDTSESNPLQTLQTNVITTFEHSYKSQEYVSLMIPVQQFSRSVLKMTLVKGHGFARKVKLNNKYYSAVFHTIYSDGTRKKIGSTHSAEIYDPYTPTVKLTLDQDNNELLMSLPQVYFSNNTLGKELEAEIYTTHGKLDVDISNYAEYARDVHFDLKNIKPSLLKYSRSLDRIEHVDLKATENKIAGGSDGWTFEELRNRCIHNSFHTTVLTTPTDLKTSFQDAGFKVEKHLDNLTRRIYFAHKLLTDGNENIVHSKHCPIRLTEDTPEEVPTILTNMDGNITILPTTLYEYIPEQGICVPLTEERIKTLDSLSSEDLISHLNESTYTRSPFTIRLITDNKYPRCASYNLANPKINSFVFEKENENTVAQMTTSDGVVRHLDGGAGGYEVLFPVKKSEDLLEIPEELLKVYVYITSKDGEDVGIEAELSGTYEDQFVYKFNIDTDYWIDVNDGLSVTNLTYDGYLHRHTIDLDTTLNIVFLVDNTVLPGVETPDDMYDGLPEHLNSSKYTCVVRQSCNLVLGENIDDSIYNDIDLQFTNEVFRRHKVDVPLTYTQDTYELDKDGTPKYIIDDEGNVKLNKLTSKGDIVYDEQGDPMYKHRVGEVYIGDDGRPEVEKERITQYLIHALQIDAKVYASEHPTQVEYRKGITSTIMRYIDTLRNKKKELLEQTELYFKSLNTLGHADFHIGDGVIISQPLDGKYDLKCHVYDHVAKSIKVQDSIRQTVIDIIEKHLTKETVSLTLIANEIKNTMSEYITSVDVFGINGRYDLQTMTIIDKDSQPSIRTDLYVSKDGLVSLRKHVNITFISNQTSATTK